jgi:hypothetical protein
MTVHECKRDCGYGGTVAKCWLLKQGMACPHGNTPPDRCQRCGHLVRPGEVLVDGLCQWCVADDAIGMEAEAERLASTDICPPREMA